MAATERLLDAVDTRRAIHPINAHDGIQLQLYDYPSSAVREIVVNALVHRDFEFAGSVEVEHTPERLRISSPGGLVFGVTPDNILSHPSTPRNRLLLETVTALQVAERTGQGVDRAYRELLRTGKPPPDYDDDGSRVAVTITGGSGNDAFARFVNAELDDAMAVDLDVLLALNYLRQRKTIRAGRLAPAIQRKEAEAQDVLDRMVDGGLIEPSRRTASRPFPNYALAPAAVTALGRAVTYHQRTSDGMDQKVVEHVSEYGYVTNQTLRRLFDLGVFPARDLLRDLQRRGILHKIDERSAGPGVRYGPGQRFPAQMDQPKDRQTP